MTQGDPLYALLSGLGHTMEPYFSREASAVYYQFFWPHGKTTFPRFPCRQAEPPWDPSAFSSPVVATLEAVSWDGGFTMQREPNLQVTHHRDASSDITKGRYVEKTYSFGHKKTSILLSY